MRWLIEHQYILILLLMIIVLLGSVMIFINSRKINKNQITDHSRHIMEIIIREQEKNKRLAKRVEALEEEIATLKYELDETDKNANAFESNQSNLFQNNLQYQTFMQNNQELVTLLQNGLSIEKAAKASNRSVREVEMVEAVLKQRSNTQKKVD